MVSARFKWALNTPYGDSVLILIILEDGFCYKVNIFSPKIENMS